MRIAVLSSLSSWYVNDLKRAAASRHDVVPVPFAQMGAGTGDGLRAWSVNTRFEEYDVVLVRTMPPGSLEQIVFRMDVLGQLAAKGQFVLNPPRAIEASVDKFLASAKLHAAGLLTPKTYVCQTVDDAMIGFDRLGGDVVVKPLFGSEGRGITRVSDENIALRVFHALVQLSAVIYLQQFVPHEGHDIRLLVVGERVLAMRRINPRDWRTNVSRGATTEPIELDEQLSQLARRAAQSEGAPLAGVDVLPGRDGRMYVLEVNAVPGWKALAQTLDVDIAAEVLEYLERSVGVVE